MAPLSFRLAGIVLDHQRYGEHLDKRKKTIDNDLEMKNFEGAGKEVAELWHDAEWASYKIDAKYVAPPPSDDLPAPKYEEVDAEWFHKHAR